MYVGIFGQMYRGFCKPTEVIDEKKFKSEYSQLPRDLKLTRTALKVLTKFFKKNPKLPKCTKSAYQVLCIRALLTTCKEMKVRKRSHPHSSHIPIFSDFTGQII